MSIPARRLVVALGATLIVVGGCSSARPAQGAPDDLAEASEVRRNDCALRAQDTVFVARGVVYRDCAVDVKARVLSRITPDYSATPGGCASAMLEFVVDTAGRADVATARVVRSNNALFAESVMRTISQVRFAPATRDGVKVQQILVYGLTSSSVVVRVSAGSPPPPRGTMPRTQRC